MEKPTSASHFKGHMKSPYYQYAVGGHFKKKIEPILINYSEEDRRNNKRVCVATLGSSHTEQHHETITELAIKYNVSLGLFACSATKMAFFTKNRK